MQRRDTVYIENEDICIPTCIMDYFFFSIDSDIAAHWNLHFDQFLQSTLNHTLITVVSINFYQRVLYVIYH